MRALLTVTGIPKVVDMTEVRPPFTIGATVGAGCSLLIEYSVQDRAYDNPGAARWFTWGPGTITASDLVSMPSPVTAIRATRVSGSNTCYVDIVS